MEKQLEELKQLQDENNKKLSLLEDSLRNKFIPDDNDLYISEKKVKKEEELVLPKLSNDCNVTKAENVDPPKRPSSSSSNHSEKANKPKSPTCKSPANGNSKNADVKEEKKYKNIDEQVDALVSHYRRDGYDNKPWIGNKPTSFEYEKMKKLPSSKTNIKVK